MYTRILKLVLAPPGPSRIFSCWSNTGQKYVWGLRKTQFSVTVPKNPPHHLRVEGRGLPLGLQRHFPCAVTTAPLALHKTGRYVCLWASGVQGPIAFLSARDWSPRLELPGFEPVLSNVVPWRRCSRSSANKNYWGSFEVCASLRARCSLILPLSPHTSPGGHCPHLAAFFFLTAATLRKKHLERFQMRTQEFMRPGVRHVNAL